VFVFLCFKVTFNPWRRLIFGRSKPGYKRARHRRERERESGREGERERGKEGKRELVERWDE
jgi:hypothetical protein